MRIYFKFLILFFNLQTAFCMQTSKIITSNYETDMDIHFLTTNCQKALELLSIRLNQTDIEDEDIWALQMLDASSKMPVGLLSYNFGEMGNFKECTEIVSKKDEIEGKYCLGNIVVNSSSMNTDPIYLQSHMYLKSLMSKVAGGIQFAGNPTFAICLPSNCSDDDAVYMMSMIVTLGLSIDTVTCQTLENVYPPLNKDAIVGISILSILLLFIIVSTILDFYCLYYGKANVRRILVVFSLYNNSKDLFKFSKRNSNLSCLDGLRVLSMFWIMMLHTYSIYTLGPLFNSKDVVDFTNSIYSMLIITGDLACDTFLIIAGTLVTYVFFSSDKKKLTVTDIFVRYIHRYIRLTPALTGVVLVSATLLRYLGSGPKWPYIVKNFEGFCKDYWWTTLLYIQNQYNVTNMCAGHSWYLNVDMQLYILSPIILFILKKNEKTGIAVLIITTLSSIILSYLRAYSYEMSGVTSTFYAKTPASVYMNNYYLKTETRAAPWLMGNILGFILTKQEFRTNVDKKYIIPMWLLTIPAILLCVLSGHATLRSSDYRRVENAIYISLLRPSFALIVGWIIWACATNNGGIVNKFLSLPIFQFLNQFIYSMYLLHVTSLYMIVFSSKTSIYFSIFNMAYWFWGIFMFMFILSVVWVLVFEKPMLALEKIMFFKE